MRIFPKIVSLHTTKLEKDARYLICLDKKKVSQAEAYQLINGLRSVGISNAVGFMVDGDPNQIVKIIEQKDHD